jgi:predicted XRE-type DNA-binding protein
MPTPKTKRSTSRPGGAAKSVGRPVTKRAAKSATGGVVRASAPPVAGPVEASSGNVFADLGFADAADRLAKAELARIVRGIVRERMDRDRWTQARAARELAITAPDMSDLMRGKLARFSQERLEQFLTRLGMEVRILVGPRPAGKARAEITVERVAAFA